MTHRFFDLTFTPEVQAVQQEMGSRASYARFETSTPHVSDRLTGAEQDFIRARDSFYIATVSETGWPYVQHRGGPTGFLKVLDDRTVGFADYRGNRQYVSVGNLASDNRVALFLMDYPNQRRLKLLGHARTVDMSAEPDLIAALRDPYGAQIERAVVISVEAYDWNCPQHITPRFTEKELENALAPLRENLRALQAENSVLRAKVTTPPV